MTRPKLIWLIAIVCSCIVFGAIGMMSLITLRMERDRYVEDQESERFSGAITLIEDYVSSLLARENSRSAADYAQMQTRFNQTAGKGGFEVENGLSPLFAEQPDDANYYWYTQIDDQEAAAKISSPHLPSWASLEDIAPNKKARNKLEGNMIQHEELKILLNKSSDWTTAQENQGIKKFGSSNLGKLCHFASSVAVQFEEQVIETSDDRELLAEAVSNESVAWMQTNNSDEEDKDSIAVLEKRVRAATKAQSYSNVGKQKVDEFRAKKSEQKFALDVNQSDQIEQIDAVNVLAEGNPYFARFDGAAVSPFTALWVSEELMLIRKVATKNGEFIQGIWLNHEKVEADILGLAQTYLPNAALQNVTESIDFKTLSYSGSDLFGLTGLPYRLLPGDMNISFNQLTPMRVNLIIAWVAAILAMVAIGIMLRGVMVLSERRASFVSSVSHELRTPLTTFKLYSEMLAGGMVTDPEKRQSYLETLMRESDRLSHMVENVLSFSLIERNKSSAEKEELEVRQIVDRAELNMDLVLSSENIRLENHLDEDLLAARVMVDSTSVDQIISNILDNVVKYGKTGDSGVVHLTAKREGNWFMLQISDEGNGILKSNEREIFKAFHKSDIEAAHGKPGVGLGLALCRGLARGMGGDLYTVPSPLGGKGACFELKLLLVV